MYLRQSIFLANRLMDFVMIMSNISSQYTLQSCGLKFITLLVFVPVIPSSAKIRQFPFLCAVIIWRNDFNLNVITKACSHYPLKHGSKRPLVFWVCSHYLLFPTRLIAGMTVTFLLTAACYTSLSIGLGIFPLYGSSYFAPEVLI